MPYGELFTENMFYKMYKKTYIKLFAGLGNQIFQYCYGLLQHNNGWKVNYILNKTYDKNGKSHDLTEVFNLYDINGDQATNIFAPERVFSNIRINAKKVFAKYIIRSYQTGFYQRAEYIEELTKNNNIHDILKFKNERTYIKTETYNLIEQCTNPVSLHIRGGDYLSDGSPYSGICTHEYYSKAILYFKENTIDPHFFIFSNDKDFCLSIFSALKMESANYTIVVDEPYLKDDPGFDLFLMSKCSHNIIANSTYSWWGAYLNQNNNKIVITPSKWTKNDDPSLEEIKPRSWISL